MTISPPLGMLLTTTDFVARAQGARGGVETQAAIVGYGGLHRDIR